ncbi:hypothetical protein GO491_09265 [Flavobacteriaceae bacterium Ap0902]|nr:hypothetical protein [Flavobacteriaceae bacterium Ap0902]
MKVFDNLPINIRLFIIIFILILFTGITTGLITFFHFKNTTETFYTNTLNRKEQNIKTALERQLSKKNQETSRDDLYTIFKNKVPESSAIQDIQIDVYDLEGLLLTSSNPDLSQVEKSIHKNDLAAITTTHDNIKVPKAINEQPYLKSYSYLYNDNQEPSAILGIPFVQDQSIISSKIFDLYKNLVIGNVIAVSLAILLAW